jgi:uncharacterized membrane protein YgdD (TMEM256/DUF423 family)
MRLPLTRLPLTTPPLTRLPLVVALAASLAVSLGAPPAARADDDKPQPPHHHSAMWYGGWSYVGVGGVATLLGVALTTRDDSASSTAGWVLAGVGTATWVAGALLLRFGEKRAAVRRRY